MRREEQALADGSAHRILAERFRDQEGRLHAAAGEQPFGKGGDEDRRHRRDGKNVLHRIDPRRSVGKLDIGEDEAGVGFLERRDRILMGRRNPRNAVAEVADDLLELHRDQRLVLDNEDRGPRFAVEFAHRIGEQRFDGLAVGAGDQARFLDRKAFERGEQQDLAAERGDLDQASVRGADQRMLVIVAAFAIVDESAFPDAVEVAVEVDACAVAAMEFVRRGDDDFEGRVDEIVAMLLAACQRARV